MPGFSVVIAAYQASGTIADAVASALDQVPPPVEVIVADDGSTDDIEGALAPFGEKVTLLRGEHRGEAAAKTRGARAASGEFVVLLDADDVYLPGRIEALGRLAARRPDLDLLTTDANMEVEGRVIGRCYHAGHRFAIDDQRRAILERNFVFGLAAIRREALLAAGGFDESIRYTTDWECWIRLILGGSRAGLVDEPLATYRLHESAMSASRLEMYRGRVQTLRKAREHPSLSPAEREIAELVMAQEERRAAREALDVALASRERGVRRLARAVLTDGGQPRRSRVKAAAVIVLPWAVGAIVRRERRSEWVGVGDMRIPRARAGATGASGVGGAGSGD